MILRVEKYDNFDFSGYTYGLADSNYDIANCFYNFTDHIQILLTPLDRVDTWLKLFRTIKNENQRILNKKIDTNEMLRYAENVLRNQCKLKRYSYIKLINSRDASDLDQVAHYFDAHAKAVKEADYLDKLTTISLDDVVETMLNSIIEDFDITKENIDTVNTLLQERFRPSEFKCYVDNTELIIIAEDEAEYNKQLEILKKIYEFNYKDQRYCEYNINSLYTPKCIIDEDYKYWGMLYEKSCYIYDIIYKRYNMQNMVRYGMPKNKEITALETLLIAISNELLLEHSDFKSGAKINEYITVGDEYYEDISFKKLKLKHDRVSAIITNDIESASKKTSILGYKYINEYKLRDIQANIYHNENSKHTIVISNTPVSFEFNSVIRN